MKRTTIDFGIDLGTTNSAIAVINDIDANIIKNNQDQDITPSAVSYSNTGSPSVGVKAVNRLITNPNDAYREFKRLMGTNHEYQFAAAKIKKTPEDLSAEVLKSLRNDVASKTGEEISSAVITVPAAFELNQIDATKKAAQLAGLIDCPLLQEPIAAAMAYGFQIDSEKGYWLVYDFGGGTFDAALLKADEGIISVVHHGGDNFLGGSDIDWGILQKFVIPVLKKNYNFANLDRGKDQYGSEVAILKSAIEAAKIELTTSESTNLTSFTSLKDLDGNDVDLDSITLTRADVISIVEPLVKRSAEQCKQVLKEKNLNANGLNRVILVGGPTKAKYFRDILEAELGVPLDNSMDPLTVVARGAAFYSSTQKIKARKSSSKSIGEYKIDFLNSNKTAGAETDPLIGGKVIAPNGSAIVGMSVQAVNILSQWTSDKVNVTKDGTFFINLLAEKGKRNTFKIELFDPNGIRIPITDNECVYTVAATIAAEIPLIKNVGVALSNNTVKEYFAAGSPIPQTHKQTLKSTKTIRAGEGDVAIVVPIIEGNNSRADRNRSIGSIAIKASALKRDLRMGADIEVEIEITASRTLRAVAFIADLDYEQEQSFDLRTDHRSADDLSQDLKNELNRVKNLSLKCEESESRDIGKELDAISKSELVTSLKELVVAAKGDTAAALQADHRLLELKLKLDQIEMSLELPTIIDEAKDWIAHLKRVVSEDNSSDAAERCQKVCSALEKEISNKNAEGIKIKQAEVEKLYFELQSKRPAYWIGQFKNLQHQKFTNQSEADRLIQSGHSYIDRDNFEGLRNVVSELWSLLPDEVSNEIKAYGSTVIG